MKKVLATVAALGLILGVAGNVLALDKPGTAAEAEADTAPRVPAATAPGVALWSVSGSWVLAGAYLSNGEGNPGGADLWSTDASSDAFYIHSFKILPVLQVNDKVSMKGEIRFVDRHVFGNESLAHAGATKDINAYHVYMEWMSPIGKTRFGRTPAGAWGSKFLNSTSQGNRLMLWGNWMPENMGMLIFTQKVEENDAGATSADQDEDAYYIDFSYKADFGKTVVALWNVRHAESPAAGDDTWLDQHLWLYGNYKFDNIGLEYEARWVFGDASATQDANAYGLFADLSMNMGDMTVGGLFIYASGDDNPAATSDKENVMGSAGLGKDFNPYQLMTGDYMNLLNGDNPLSGVGVDSAVSMAGVWSVGAYANYKVSPKMTISGELGYFAAAEEMTGWDDDMGFEAGVGMSYKLYNNLTYSAHFSYLFTGDFWKGGLATQNIEDVYLLAHALSMKF